MFRKIDKCTCLFWSYTGRSFLLSHGLFVFVPSEKRKNADLLMCSEINLLTVISKLDIFKLSCDHAVHIRLLRHLKVVSFPFILGRTCFNRNPSSMHAF